MLSAVRAAFRSFLLPTSRAITSRGYRFPISSYLPRIRRSQLWYRLNRTQRSQLIGALNMSFALIYAYTVNAKLQAQRTETALSLLLLHEVFPRDYDFSSTKDSLDFFFTFIAQDKGDVREGFLNLFQDSPSAHKRFRMHLDQYRQIYRDYKEDPVKTGLALLRKKKEMISDMELRLLELPAIEAERLFHESPRGQRSPDGRTYEEVG